MIEEPDIRLTLFGGPRFTKGGHHIRVSPYQAAFITLVYAYDPGGLSRARMAWLLWESDDGSEARHRIRQLLHGLKGKLGVDPVYREEDRLAPAPDALVCDYTRYSAAINERRLEAAAAIYSAEFAPRLTRPPTREYEDWLNAKRVRLRRELKEAAARAWTHALGDGDWIEGKDAAEALFALDPQSELYLRHVIESRAMAGDIEGADAAYIGWAEEAAAEGIRPAQETLELVDRVRGLRQEGRFGTARAASEPLFRGRQDTLRLISKFLEQDVNGPYPVLVIEGEPGIGKTRCLAEVQRISNVRGFRTHAVQCTQMEQLIPLNCLVDILSQADIPLVLSRLDEPSRGVLRFLLPTLLSSSGDSSPPEIREDEAPRRLFEAFRQVLNELASGAPLLLLIDDIHWIDQTSARVLEFVRRRWQGGPLFLVATARTDHLDGVQLLIHGISNTHKNGLCRVALDELDQDAAAALVTDVSDHRIGAAQRDAVCELSHGNPFYVIELTRAYLSGHLELSAHRNGKVTLPVSIRELVGQKLDKFDLISRSVLDALAVWPRWLTVRIIADLTEASIMAVIRALEELGKAGIIQVAADKARIAHDLFRYAIYGNLSETRRAVLHGKVVSHLERLDSDCADELAIHCHHAGLRTEAASLARQAASRALHAGAVAEAIAFTEMAMENADLHDDKLHAMATLGELHFLQRDLQKASPLLAAAASGFRSIGEYPRAVRLELKHAMAMAGAPSSPIGHLIKTVLSIKEKARAAGDWEGTAHARETAIKLFHRLEDLRGIRNMLREAEREAERGSTIAQCVTSASLALGVLYGIPSRALEFANNAVELATLAQSHEHRFNALNRLILVLLYRGRLELDEGRATVSDAKALAEASGDVSMRFALEANLGVFHMDTGNYDLASNRFRKAATLIEGVSFNTGRLNLLFNCGELEVLQGNYAKAESYFNDAGSALSATTPKYMRVLINAGLGLCAVESGRFSEASRREQAVDSYPEWWYYDPSLLVTFRARMYERRGQAQRAAEHFADSESDLKDRLTLAWLKMRLHRVRLLRKLGDTAARTVASEAAEVCSRLQLRTRAAEFSLFEEDVR